METRGSMGESREEPAPLTYMDRTATKKKPGLAAARYGGLFESTGPGDRTEGTPGCDAFQSEHPALGPGAAGWSSTTWARLVYACSCMTPAVSRVPTGQRGGRRAMTLFFSSPCLLITQTGTVE